MVAITDKYRRLIEKRRLGRRSALLPMRVTRDGAMLFEGATVNVADDGVYFRMPGGETLSIGSRLHVEINVPAALAGGKLGYRTMRRGTVVRIENTTLARRVGCHPRSCGVALALDPEAAAPAAAQRRETAAVA